MGLKPNRLLNFLGQCKFDVILQPIHAAASLWVVNSLVGICKQSSIQRVRRRPFATVALWHRSRDRSITTSVVFTIDPVGSGCQYTNHHRNKRLIKLIFTRGFSNHIEFESEPTRYNSELSGEIFCCNFFLKKLLQNPTNQNGEFHINFVSYSIVILIQIITILRCHI